MPFRKSTGIPAFATSPRYFTNILNTHGPEAVAFYGSGQLDTETVYLVSKLFKGYLGCNNTDSNSRLCMAAAVAGYRTSLGSDGPPTCYDDIDLADVIVIMGSNMAEAHPVTFDRVKASKKANPQQQIVVIDPRRTADGGGCRPVSSGRSPAAISPCSTPWAACCSTMGAADKRLHRRAHARFRGLSPVSHGAGRCRIMCGRRRARRRGFLAGIADRRGTKVLVSFYCMGLNQSTVGMWKNNSLINLHLLTGQIGKPGAGPFSLTGQPNAMGGREGGLLSHQLPGYRTVEDEAHRADAERFWGRRSGNISPKVGLTAVEMFRAWKRASSRPSGLPAPTRQSACPICITCAAPCKRRSSSSCKMPIIRPKRHAWPMSFCRSRSGAKRNGPAPTANAWSATAQSSGTPPGEALPDWEILARFARTLGLSRASTINSADEVWDEFIQMTSGRPCDMAGATSRALARAKQLAMAVPDAGPSRQQATYPRSQVFHSRWPGRLFAARS